MYKKYWDAIEDRRQVIEKMKKQVTRIEKEQEAMELWGTDEEPDQMEDMEDEDGNPIKYKIKKTKMCDQYMKTGRCTHQQEKQKFEAELRDKQRRAISYVEKQAEFFYHEESEEGTAHKRPSLKERQTIGQKQIGTEISKYHRKCLPEDANVTKRANSPGDDGMLVNNMNTDGGDDNGPNSEDRRRLAGCKFAHNPLELELIPLEIKIKNLNGVVERTDKKLRVNRPQRHWVPGGVQDGIEDTSVYEPYQAREAYNEEQEKDDEKSKSIFDKENIFRKPFEDKE